MVAWNCAGKFVRNAAALAALDADICIVPEVLEGHTDALGDAYSIQWHGDKDQRGLLIAAKRDWRIDAVQSASQRHMILTTLNGPSTSLAVIGVWAMRGPRGYVGSVIDGLDTLLPLIAASPNVFVAGDFNASSVFDASSPPALRFAEIARRLQDAGLVSLWHDRAGETFGAESCATYHHQWKQEQPFHIDFAFASKALAARCRYFEIGKFDPWCQSSDHMPLIADFDS